MKKPEKPDDTGTWIFKDIPRDLMRRAKSGAALQGKSLRQIVIELMENFVHDTEKRGRRAPP